MARLAQDIAASTLAYAFPEEHELAGDLQGWLEQVLRERLWSKQREIADSLTSNRYTAVQSAHGTGKSYMAARAVAHWIATHPIGEAFAVTTAPTGPQVEAVIWRELSQAHGKANLPGRITRGAVPRWHIGPELVAFGRKPQDLVDTEQAAAAFQGIHAKYVLVVIDEAAGVNEWLWDAVDSLVTNETSRVLAIGNPTDPTSAFAKRCKPGSGWNVLKISAFDTPAFTGEKVPPRLFDVLVSERWVEERRKRWGEGTPLWVSKVLGEFPEEAEDTLITPRMIEEAHALEVRPTEGIARKLGVDVARAGADRTVIASNHGGRVRIIHNASGHDTMRTAGTVARALRSDPSSRAIVDIIGVGAGVYDSLREQGLAAAAFQASEKARQSERFANRRAESFWALREALQAGEIDLDPADEELTSQLLALRWKVDSRGRTLIESKDEMRKRGLPSPDRADAVAMTFEAPWALMPSVGERNTAHVIPDYLNWSDGPLGKFRETGSFTSDLMDFEW